MFDCDYSLFELPVRLHCPLCGRCFHKSESRSVDSGRGSRSSVARINADFRPEMVYEPKEERND